MAQAGRGQNKREQGTGSGSAAGIAIGVHDQLGSEQQSQEYVLLVGPEGDWTAEEVESLVLAGARPVGLGRLRLRTETAAISLLAAISNLTQ